MTETMKVRLSGRVQGVGFRAWTRARAIQLNLRGWVRNEADGSVTALISGEPAQVAQMLSDLGVGPPGSAVTDVESHPAESPKEPGFEVRH